MENPDSCRIVILPAPNFPGGAAVAVKNGQGASQDQEEMDEIATEASGEKLLEPLLFSLTDRTHFWRMLPGAQVTANTAPPYGNGKSFRDNRGGLRRSSFSISGGRSPLGNRGQVPFSFEDLLRNVKGAVAGVMLG